MHRAPELRRLSAANETQRPKDGGKREEKVEEEKHKIAEKHICVEWQSRLIRSL